MNTKELVQTLEQAIEGLGLSRVVSLLSDACYEQSCSSNSPRLAGAWDRAGQAFTKLTDSKDIRAVSE